MKKLSLLILCVLLCMGAMSQQEQDPTILKKFKLIVVEKKGKTDTHVFFASQDIEIPIIQPGDISFDQVLPQDTLVLTLGKKNYFVQVQGLDSVYLTINKNKIKVYKDYPSGQKVDFDTSTTSSLDMGNLDGYTNLAEYLQGRIAGVNVVKEGSGYNVYVRGPKSLMADNSALVVLNGMVLDSFNTAVQAVSVQSIKSVEVIKDGAGYGSRGANGVIVIRTK
jgi:Outer membrane receptor proteins, mostly Fe transport